MVPLHYIDMKPRPPPSGCHDQTAPGASGRLPPSSLLASLPATGTQSEFVINFVVTRQRRRLDQRGSVRWRLPVRRIFVSGNAPKKGQRQLIAAVVLQRYVALLEVGHAVVLQSES